MNTEVIPYAGWARNLRLANASVELIITLDVGPRVLSYRTHRTDNVFKTYNEQLGGTGETEWMIRGGHRLWLAPEHAERSYHLDNKYVDFEPSPAGDGVVISSLLETGCRIRKTLEVSLVAETSAVRVTHTATNEGTEPISLATWALSVMKPGGLAIIPQPPLGEHPRDLLPNRGMILWPYTDLSDPRWIFGRSVFTLRQSDGFPPTKIGLAHREKWVAYVVEDSLFIKTFAHLNGEIYPDGGCNFEIFSNSEMLEIESLSPLAVLPPRKSISHTEEWYLFPLDTQISIDSEESLAQWIQPFLKQANL